MKKKICDKKNCELKPYREVYKGAGKSFGWNYLCREHFKKEVEAEAITISKSLSWCTAR